MCNVCLVGVHSYITQCLARADTIGEGVYPPSTVPVFGCCCC